MDLKTVSSAQTFVMKVVFPIFWISVFGLGTLLLWLGTMHGPNGEPPPDAMRWVFLGAWVLGSAFILWICAGLKRVRVDATRIYVSNYLREEPIALNLIKAVTEIRWINIHPVTVHFRTVTAFGERITFMPKIRVFGLFTAHPVVAELRRLAGLAGGGDNLV